MKKREMNSSNEISIKNIKGYFERKVTKFGTGAKIDIPKEFLGEDVIVVIKKKGEGK